MSIEVGAVVVFTGYQGDLPNEYTPSLEPGQPVKIIRIDQDDAGNSSYIAALVDSNNGIIEDFPPETLFDKEFKPVEKDLKPIRSRVTKSAPGSTNKLHENMANSDLGYLESEEDNIPLDDGTFWTPESVAEDDNTGNPEVVAQLVAREYTLHPITDRFPEMSEAAFEELKADIEERGQLVPIVVLPNSQIIDGKHRFRVCQELGIPPLVEVYTGPQTEKALFAHVRGLNARRRHLTAEELNAFAIKRTTQGASQRQIAKEAGVTQQAISKSLKQGGDNQLSLNDSPIKSKGKWANKKTGKSFTATDKQFNALMRAWDKANEDARHRFVEVVGLGG